jgi:Ni/Co efflux regulator RcnB
MRTALIASLFLAAAVITVNTQAIADDHDNAGYVHHAEWKKGAKMQDADWHRAAPVGDYKAHHLRAPPHGYEWRQVDGNYVLAAVDTGVIRSVVKVTIP